MSTSTYLTLREDTLRALRKDFGTFLTSVDPSGEADDRQTLNIPDNE